MVKFKNYLSLYAVTTAMLFFVHDVSARQEVNGNGSGVTNNNAQSNVGRSEVENSGASCNGEASASFYKCSDGKSKVISDKTYEKNGSGNVNIAIEVSKDKTSVKGDKITVKSANAGASNEAERKIWEIGAKASEGGKIVLNSSTLKDVSTGVDVAHGSVVIENGTIDANKVGVFAHTENGVSGRSYVNLVNTNIKASNKAIGLLSRTPEVSNGNEENKSISADIMMKGGTVDFTGGTGVKTEGKGYVALVETSITGKGLREENTERSSESSAFHISKDHGFIHFIKGKVDVVDAHGILLQAKHGSALLSESTVVVKGGEDFYGMRFLKDEEGAWKNGGVVAGVYTVDLQETSFTVPNGTAVYSSKFRSSVTLAEGTVLSGDLLLKADDSSSLEIFANSSVLSGGSHVDESSIILLNLRNSKWTLSRPQYQKVQDSNSIDKSFVSRVSLADSSIVFSQPKADIADGYQTLCVGEGAKKVSRPYGRTHIVVIREEAVYSAQGDTHLYLNTYLNKGGALKDQKTDRVLIYGDVEGKTIVHVQTVSGSPGGGTGSGGNNHGISIIQVSGEAKEDSFTLDGGYVALENLPYQYKLYAYGPSSSLGKAHSEQRLVKGEGEFWDFRLENRYVDPAPKPEPEIVLRPQPSAGTDSNFELRPDQLEPLPEQVVRSVVPQVPTYLLLPNSIFHAGLVDINNQNKQLEAVRIASGGTLEARENPALYLRGYGGRYRYASDLSALEYGYGGDVDYNGIEAGILLKTIENVGSTVSFGVMGSYGKLSLQPLEVEQSQKSAFDKWTASAYGTVQHDAGFYVDGLLSYGLFKGDVLTFARGKTATLKGNPLSVSLTGGQSFATGYKGVVFEPQAQVVYQHLQFSKARDIDNFDIEMGTLDQWVARVGGRLSKLSAGSEGVNVVAFYGKLYFAHGFGGKQTVHFKDAFQLGAFGSSLEAGLGFNARLSQNFSLHTDLIYQHKLDKAGFSGISFSGGARYQF
ncbi:outer membrane autotransporter protein [Bartonella japonica]|uniref:Outer membrane autotransporter protein n=1 Tax=Bartonella japonica TaxID=357761 RepID=A0ABV2FPM4_9HYPH